MRIALSIAVILFSVAAWSSEDEQRVGLEEAPLDDVWPTLSVPRLGDLDAMVARGEIRVLTSFTLGSYFIDQGEQRGTVYEMSKILEEYVRQKVGADARRLKITIIPVRRDQILPYLVEGHGDVAFANLTITPGRSQVVDFSYPFSTDTRASRSRI